jgi:Amt family ammonium transporter
MLNEDFYIFIILKLRGYVVFLFFWSVFVYDIVAYWTWSKNGWLRNLGSLDFAGGTVVHIVAGMSGLA